MMISRNSICDGRRDFSAVVVHEPSTECQLCWFFQSDVRELSHAGAGRLLCVRAVGRMRLTNKSVDAATLSCVPQCLSLQHSSFVEMLSCLRMYSAIATRDETRRRWVNYRENPAAIYRVEATWLLV